METTPNLDPSPSSRRVAEALSEDGIPEPERWAALLGVIMLRFRYDPTECAAVFAREWNLVDTFDEFFETFGAGPRDEKRAAELADAFDEHLVPYINFKPF